MSLRTRAKIGAAGDRRREKRWGYPWLTQEGGRWKVRFPWADDYARRHKTDAKWVKQAQVVWVQANGPIPPGHVIHHLDLNPLNDALSNLACWPNNKHWGFHGNLKQHGRAAGPDGVLVTV